MNDTLTRKQKAEHCPLDSLIELASLTDVRGLMAKNDETAVLLEQVMDEGHAALRGTMQNGVHCTQAERELIQSYLDLDHEYRALAAKLKLSPNELRLLAEQGNALAVQWRDAKGGADCYRRALGSTLLALTLGEAMAANAVDTGDSVVQKDAADFARDKHDIALGAFLVEIAKRKARQDPDYRSASPSDAAQYLDKRQLPQKTVMIVRCSDNGYSPEEFKRKYVGIKLCIAGRKMYDRLQAGQ